MSIDTIVFEAKRYAEKLMNGKKASFKEKPEFNNTPGVYIIYEGNEVIYIGQSINLKNRFKNHLSESKNPRGSTFRRLLIKKFGISAKETKNHIFTNYSVSCVEIQVTNLFNGLVKAFDMCKLVESILIAYYRPICEGLLNSSPKLPTKNIKQ